MLRKKPALAPCCSISVLSLGRCIHCYYCDMARTVEVPQGEVEEVAVEEATDMQDESGAVVWDAALVLAHYIIRSGGRSGCVIAILTAGTGAQASRRMLGCLHGCVDQWVHGTGPPAPLHTHPPPFFPSSMHL